MANIQATDLDFDAIKQSIKTYLGAQSEFSDYDFEGSALSVLIDILAYNTHYNAYLANMLANEMFLDSAVKRESAVSIAKHLQYTPSSITGATALVTATYASQPGSPLTMTLPRYSAFTTTINGTNYLFNTTDDVTVQISGGQYVFQNLEIKEGIHVTNAFSVVTGGPTEKYILNNTNADISTIRVRVQTSITDTTTIAYTNAANFDITAITSTSSVFFLEQNQFGNYEIFFGDGSIGRRLAPGNIIYIDYLVTVGSPANVSNTIGAAQIFTGPTVNSVAPSVVTSVSSNGGSAAETIDEIKFNAPRAYATQNRLVTVDDYVTTIKRYVSYAKAISVWGGEDSDPPQYGKVFISILPTSGNYLTTQQKTSIIDNVLGSKRAVAVTPEIVDPEYFYINVATSVKYNTLTTTKTADEIRANVTTQIQNYFNTNLNSFNEPFLFSRLTSAIDDTDQSILGNLTKVKIQSRFTPSLTIANSNRILFNNTLLEGTLDTTRFVYNRNGVLIQAKVKDVPDAATVKINGTYRRSGSIITATFTSPHGLTKGETVYLDFTGSAAAGNYVIESVISSTVFTVISVVTGSTSGSVFVTSKPRGSLLLYNPITLETLVTSVGFVSYLEGIVQFENLFVAGFTQGAKDIRVTVGLDDTSRDVNVYRNQILLLDDSNVNPNIDQAAGLTVTVVPVAA